MVSVYYYGWGCLLWQHCGTFLHIPASLRSSLCLPFAQPANVLVTPDGTVKVADMGLVRGSHYDASADLTPGNKVVSLWYR